MRRSYIQHLRLLPLLFLLVAAGSACEENVAEETALFERAEEAYAHGDYEGATSLYRRFVEEHPLSPLAEISRRRMLLIEREFNSLISRRNAPPPVYVNPRGTSAPIEADAPRIAPVHARPLPVLGE